MMKPYRKCKKRIAEKHLSGSTSLKELNYFLSLKPGDWISGCFHWPNAMQIISVKHYWYRISAKARILDVIEFRDAEGRSHWFPGAGGCVDKWNAGRNEPGYVHNPNITTPLP